MPHKQRSYVEKMSDLVTGDAIQLCDPDDALFAHKWTSLKIVTFSIFVERDCSTHFFQFFFNLFENFLILSYFHILSPFQSAVVYVIYIL